MLVWALIAIGGTEARGQASDEALAQAEEGRINCARLVAAKDKDLAKPATDSAEAAFERLTTAYPRDFRPKVGRARVLGECRMALAGFMSKGRVFDEGVQLLNEALTIAPKDWGARFALAQFYDNAPDFLGHRKDAIRELERIPQDHAGEAYFPEMATPYRMLGDLYIKEKRETDAVAVWKRGAALFPNNEGLKKRIEKHSPRGGA
jgi:tetratricopeptide (TPR) repeat protein